MIERKSFFSSADMCVEVWDQASSPNPADMLFCLHVILLQEKLRNNVKIEC